MRGFRCRPKNGAVRNGYRQVSFKRAWPCTAADSPLLYRAIPGVRKISDFNSQIIEEFRANGGRVGGPFEGAPMVLVHHQGRRSGTSYVAPMMYLPDADADADANAIYVFASKAGAPTNPDWYFNLTTAGQATVELGADTFTVDVEELSGATRDEVYAEQARRYPGFADYADKVKGIRTIPVLKLRRDEG